MKKQTILDLVRYHAEGNELGFRTAAYAIADEFDRNGDPLLAQYIYQQLSGDAGLVPQASDAPDFSDAFHEVRVSSAPLPLPDPILRDIMGLVKAISSHAPANKFLFQGPPGTGKTETVKHMTRLLSRKLFLIDFTPVVDSHLGQTAKNLAGIFEELGRIPNPERYLFLIDEIDAIALDRTNSQDVREMGRVTSAFLKALDELNPRVTVIATTNLYRYIDRALSRRFDAVVDFDRYSQEDLLDIADKLMARFLSEFGRPALKKSLFRKILKTGVRLPFPGELAGLIKSSLLFSDPDDPVDYLKRLYSALHGKAPAIESLRAEGFSVRDVELLTGISKSAVSRAVHEGAA